MGRGLIVALAGDDRRSLKSISGEESSNKRLMLVKEVDESYLGDTFGHLVEYMLNPATDTLNSKPYNHDEIQFANKWKNLYEQSMTSSNVSVGLKAVNNEKQLEPVFLHEIVGSYSDSIIQQKEHDGESYNGIDLILSNASGGGI